MLFDADDTHRPPCLAIDNADKEEGQEQGPGGGKNVRKGWGQCKEEVETMRHATVRRRRSLSFLLQTERCGFSTASFHSTMNGICEPNDVAKNVPATSFAIADPSHEPNKAGNPPTRSFDGERLSNPSRKPINRE
ncbi:hypothetical protein M413DRAFT_30613 [Hebeloma cylindrosporum]|uniref:Uncharacterized protein n=1 Tax=Hebeloma cylindrosporum TaxID=76867 RepID=A0A0C3BMQ2_HEBCY|nr:hypothetical protein M413DRAFT_30613 [Hebeloma cylindrosporum h7]